MTSLSLYLLPMATSDQQTKKPTSRRNCLYAVIVPFLLMSLLALAYGLVMQNERANQFISGVILSESKTLKFLDRGQINSIVSGMLPDEIVQTAEIADKAITTIKIDDGSVTSEKIADGTILSIDISSSAISTINIGDGAITNSKLADNSVTTEKILNGTIVLSDLGQNGCGNGQVMKWSSTYSSWICASDEAILLSESLVEAYIFDGDNTGILTSGTLALNSLSYTGTLGDSNVSDALTIVGGTIGANNISGLLTTTGALAVGDGGDGISIDSLSWDINSAGTGSGFTALTVDNINIDGNTIAATNDSGLALYDNGSNGIFIEDGGRVGIGTTTNLSAPLSFPNSTGKKITLYGNQYGFAISSSSVDLWSPRWFKFRENLYNGTVKAQIAVESGYDTYFNNGNVGIGTTAPNELLEISGASGRHGETPITAYLYSTDDGNWTDDSIFAQIEFGNADTDGAGDGGVKAKIAAYIDTVSAIYTGLSFYTSLNGTSIQERMRINSHGNVGIGTTSPGARLEVTNDIWITSGSGYDLKIDVNQAMVDSINFIGPGAKTFLQYDNSGYTTTIGESSSSGKVIMLGLVGIGTTAPNATLDVDGSVSMNITTKTSDYTVLDNDGLYTILVSGSTTITLPTAADNTGRILIIKRIGTDNVTIDGEGAETIDGAATQTLTTQYHAITIQCDGTSWYIIGQVN